MHDDNLAESEFERLADDTLHALVEAILDVSDELDADLESGVLTVTFDDGARYVINSHRAAKQIWMAAERSAWHFDYLADEACWRATQSGEELWAAVSGVLTRKLADAVSLQAPDAHSAAT